VKRFFQILIPLVVATGVAVAVQPSKSAKKTPPKVAKTSGKKKYVSSAS
jgi:hypothetical protein